MDDYNVMKLYDPYKGATVEVLLDPDDFQRFSSLSWHIDKTGYARMNKWIGGRSKTLLLHRCVLNMEWDTRKGICVDHINGNRLDNRKCNLRIVTYAENASNRHAVLTSTGILRVSKKDGRYEARVNVDKKPVYIGIFDSPNEAEKAIRNFMETGDFPYEKRRIRQVVQKTMGGETIAVYASCADAAKHTGVCATNILRVANHDRLRKQAGGFVWEYMN